MKLAEIIKEKNKSVCTRVAEKCNATPDYVRKIAYGRRPSKSEKARAILQELEKECEIINK